MLQWDEVRYSLGVGVMDTAHHEFTDMVEGLVQSSDGDFPALFQKLVDHTRQHFAEESRLMHLCKFPPIAIHEAEHTRVLESLGQIENDIRTGQLPLDRARAFAGSGLGEWFERHLATMDRALATHLIRTGALEVSAQASA